MRKRMVTDLREISMFTDIPERDLLELILIIISQNICTIDEFEPVIVHGRKHVFVSRRGVALIIGALLSIVRVTKLKSLLEEMA